MIARMVTLAILLGVEISKADTSTGYVIAFAGLLFLDVIHNGIQFDKNKKALAKMNRRVEAAKRAGKL